MTAMVKFILAQDKTRQGRELCCHLQRDVLVITCWSLFFPADIAISTTRTLNTKKVRYVVKNQNTDLTIAPIQLVILKNVQKDSCDFHL